MKDSEESSIVENFGAYMTNEYEVLRSVLKNLDNDDLTSCKSVCHAWQAAVLLEIQKRRCIRCYFLEPSLSEKVAPWDVDAALHITSIPIQPEDPIITKEKNCHFYAEFGIFYKNVGDKFKQTRVSKMKTAHIANRKTHLVTEFPAWEGVTVRVIKKPGNSCGPLPRNEMIELLNIPDGLPVKAVVATVISKDEDRRGMSAFLGSALSCLRERGHDFAYAGGELELQDRPIDFGIQLMIFCGTNVEAGSWVIGPNARTKNEIFNEVKNFSSNVAQSINSVMFMFRCVGRQRIKRKYNYRPGDGIVELESRAIEEYFPKTTCFGYYGLGEYGTNYSPGESNSDPKKFQCFTLAVEHHSFSTTLLYICYKGAE